uniref:Uncharacterized protein n=1 Tax=Ditylenchus dipsaci TaxID=166011 RepID=A0A915DB66_9BILA
MERKSANQMIDGLIGQANVEHARGNSKKALSLLHEAIRQAPRNVDAYNQISDVYGDLNQNEKSFEFKMLAAHMSYKTTAEEWGDVGEMALSLERLEDASACYEKWLQDLIKMVAEYYISKNDEDKAMVALETFILRSREFSRTADSQHLTLLGMWMARDRYVDCVKSILALHDGIQAIGEDGSPAVKAGFSNHGYTIEPFLRNQSLVGMLTHPSELLSWHASS